MGFWLNHVFVIDDLFIFETVYTRVNLKSHHSASSFMTSV